VLDRCVGTYGGIKVGREGSQLTVKRDGRKLLLFAESPTKFFAKTTDLQIEFKPDADGKVNEIRRRGERGEAGQVGAVETQPHRQSFLGTIRVIIVTRVVPLARTAGWRFSA